jgi:hypothetical protein
MSKLTRNMRRIALAAGAGAVLGALALAPARAAEPGVVAEVVSVRGEVFAEDASGGRRPLACGDMVRAGDRVITSADGRIGMLSGEAYTQLEPSSELVADLGPEGAPALRLERGKVRVTDERAGAASQPRHSIATPHAEAQLAGNDMEAYVFAEKAGQYSMLCEWETPLEVTRPAGTERRVAQPGECVLAKPSEPLYSAPAHDERIALAGPDACEVGTLIGDAGNRFSPTDVALGPMGRGLPPPTPLPLPFPPCAEPGSGCAGVPATPPGLGLGVIESPATGGLGDIPGLGGTP